MSNATNAMFLRLAVPVLTVGVAYAMTSALWPVMEGNLSLLFITAVTVSAMHGGLASGLIASVLGGAASAFTFLPPKNSLSLSDDDLFRLAAYVAAAVFISWLSGARRRWEEALRESRAALEVRVRERTAELEAANRDLHGEIAERRRAEARILAYQDRLRSLATELSATEERQRRAIASALHDAVGHRLAAAVMHLRGLLDVDAAQPREVTKASELVEQAIAHTRSLTLQLSPPILYELGLEPALEWLADQVREETGLSTTVECSARDLPLDDVTRTLLFSAVRELLVNVVKHARARSAQVSVSRDDEHVRISVADDGVGCETEATSSTLNGSGFGLFNIRERLGHLGGRLEVASDPGAGYRATLVAPIRPAAGPSPAVGPARPEEHALR